MNARPLPGPLAIIAATLAALGCASGTRAPERPVPPEAPAPMETTAPDRAPNVMFMRDMIAHHGQALAMTALAEQLANDPAVTTLARRIDATQIAEIERMRRWLATHGHDTTASSAHHGDHPMPGMLTDEEMAALAAASGPAFDRLFVESMIRHHEGALVMVAELLASGGGRDDVTVFQLASQIDADQRAEIERMRRLLARLR